MAAAGDSAYEGEFREIVYRHVEMIKEVIPAGAGQVALQRQIGELLNELKDIFQGIYLIRDLSPKTSDTIVSYGEQMCIRDRYKVGNPHLLGLCLIF